jgi:hypothetical protein
MAQQHSAPTKLFGDSTEPDMQTGIARSFKDLLKLKKLEQPELEVCEP